MAKKAKDGGVNKAQLIRDYTKDNPKSKPAQVSAALKEQGHDVDAQYVSMIRSQDKRKRRKKAGRPASAATAARSRGTGATPTLAAMQQAKKLADTLGGVDKAKAALEAYATLAK